MNLSNTREKSPLQAMFSCVFKREDIKLSRESFIDPKRHDSSFERPRSITPFKVDQSVVEEYPDLSKKSPSYQNIKKQTSHSAIKQTVLVDENRSRQSDYRKKAEDLKDFRYEELLKKYERMQEFYKGQISILNEEVDHYKALYHKLLKYKTSEGMN